MQSEVLAIVFENCEMCTLQPNMFKNLSIQGITETKNINCFQYEDGEVLDFKECKYFHIEIKKEALENDIDEFGRTLKERLRQLDIASIALEYDNGYSEEIYVEWADASDYRNDYQINNITEEGNMEITIEKASDNK